MPRSFNQRPRQDATLAPHPSSFRTSKRDHRNRIPSVEEIAEARALWLAAAAAVSYGAVVGVLAWIGR